MDRTHEVIIVAWSPLFGAAVKRMIESDAKFQVKAVARPTQGALPWGGGSPQPAAVVVAGACAPVPRGPTILSAVKGLTGHKPPLPIVAIVPDDCLCMHFVADLVRHGVTACLGWDSEEPEFLRCVRSVCEGGVQHSPAVSRLLRDYSSQQSRRGTRGVSRELTSTERLVAELLLESLSMQQIAFRLGRAKGTIQTHCKRIYKKLGICDHRGLYRWWTTCGNGKGNEHSEDTGMARKTRRTQ